MLYLCQKHFSASLTGGTAFFIVYFPKHAFLERSIPRNWRTPSKRNPGILFHLEKEFKVPGFPIGAC